MALASRLINGFFPPLSPEAKHRIASAFGLIKGDKSLVSDKSQCMVFALTQISNYSRISSRECSIEFVQTNWDSKVLSQFKGFDWLGLFVTAVLRY
jgi:hypothetical protein